MVGDTLRVQIRLVNLGPETVADTYVAVINGPMVFFFKIIDGVLTLDQNVAPFTRGAFYLTGLVSDEVVLALPLATSLGIDYLTFAAIMAEAGTANIISDITTFTATFE